MRLEVYLLSIPLMRHRNIVPRTRRSTALLHGTPHAVPAGLNRLPTVGSRGRLRLRSEDTNPS